MVHLTGSKFFLPSVDVHRINWKLKVMSVVWMLHPGCFSRQLPAAAEDIDSKQGDIALGPGRPHASSSSETGCGGSEF